MLLSSNHAITTIPNCFPYNDSKTGIDGLIRFLAVQWCKDVRVIGIAPGLIEPEGGEAWFNDFQDPKNLAYNLEWDKITTRFKDVAMANSYIKPIYSKPWVFPDFG